MNPSIKLLYHLECPNAAKAIEALKNARVAFEAVVQDRLPLNDPLRLFSSPSILVDDTLVFGAASTGASGACTMAAISDERIEEMIRRLQKS